LDKNNDTDKEIMRKARAKYLREKVDTIALRVPKGQKEIIRDHAKSRGESVNAFIWRVITDAIKKEKSN
jgi:predicted HicB family RNase H-like nuclease